MSLYSLFSRKKESKRQRRLSSRRGHSLSPIRRVNSEERINAWAMREEAQSAMNPAAYNFGHFTLDNGQNIGQNESVNNAKTTQLSEKEKADIVEKYNRAAAQGFNLPAELNPRGTGATKKEIIESYNTIAAQGFYKNFPTPTELNPAAIDALRAGSRISNQLVSPLNNNNALTGTCNGTVLDDLNFLNAPVNNVENLGVPKRNTTFQQQQNYHSFSNNPNITHGTPSYQINAPQLHPAIRQPWMGTGSVPLQQQRYFGLDQTLRLIPTFDGNPDKLPLFASVVRNIIANFGPSCEIYIMYELATKLVGRAADSYAARLMQYTSVEELLNDLTLQYSNILIAEDILMQLKSIKLLENKSITDYLSLIHI